MASTTLDRRAFLVGTSITSLVALQGCTYGTAPVSAAHSGSAAASPESDLYARTIHFVYARQSGKAFGNTYSDDDFIRFFDQVPGGLTAAIPFLLNVPDASIYAPMLKRMQEKGIAIFPGVGQKPGDGPINSSKYKKMATNCRPFTDCIRLENTQGYFKAHGPAPIQDLIDHCVALGFKHILLNPWPRQRGGDAYPFKNPELDSSIHQVLLEHDRKTDAVLPDPENWFPGNQAKIDAVRRYRPGINILINYESAPQHRALAKLEADHPGSSIAAMEVTTKMIAESSHNLHWNPPFTPNYDPVKLGTWDWIAKRLGELSPPKPRPAGQG